MATIVYSLTPESENVLEQHAGRASRLLAGVQDALVQGAKETAGHLQANYLRGGERGVKRDGKPPLRVRSSALIGSIDGVGTGVWEAVVGAIKGTVSRYAKVLLGDETWTITPRHAKHLWVPTSANEQHLPSSLSPREAMSQMTTTGKRLLRIFRSKRGNLVAFLPEARGANKGRLRGRLLFVLKDQVEVEGTDALALAVEDRRARVQTLIQAAVNTAMEGI